MIGYTSYHCFSHITDMIPEMTFTWRITEKAKTSKTSKTAKRAAKNSLLRKRIVPQGNDFVNTSYHGFSHATYMYLRLRAF